MGVEPFTVQKHRIIGVKPETMLEAFVGEFEGHRETLPPREPDAGVKPALPYPLN